MKSILCKQQMIYYFFGAISKASNAPSEGSIKHGKVSIDGGGLNRNTGS